MNQLDIISHKLMIVAGVILCIFGLIGNILNICVFTIWSRSRKTTNRQQNQGRTGNSPLYLLTSSIANFIVIGYSLTTRILFDGYQYQVTQNKVFMLCKLRYYTLHTFDIISLTCVCLATFDRYLISSREVRLRQMSATRQGTKSILMFVICLTGFHSIPIAVYYDVSKSGQCFIYSNSYLPYYRYTFQIFLHGIIPIFFFSLFGFLTFQQLKMIKNRQNPNQNVNVDRQLARMLLLMSIAIVLSSIPYSIENIYYLIFADQSQQQTSYVYFFHILSSILFYTNPVGSFYIYYISTPNFRIQVRKIILCKKDVNRWRNNRVNTITTALRNFKNT